MHCLITGGAGYVGTKLAERLLDHDHIVTIMDLGWFGIHLPPERSVNLIKKDARNLAADDLLGIDVVFHLAGVANDPSSILNPALCWDIALTSMYRLCEAAIRMSEPPRIIFASSGSVYGVQTVDRVTEDLELLPISTYNKSKIGAERTLLSYVDSLTIQIVRPATVCGVSPRMRLDLAVNLLTAAAVRNGVITVLGGSQYRPNIHIDDLVDAYIHLLLRPDLTGIFNAGFENITICDIAEMVSKRTGAEIKFEPSNDPRSYRIDSTKLLDTGFSPTKSVAHAIEEVITAIENKEFLSGDFNSNVNWMRYLIGEGQISEPNF